MSSTFLWISPFGLDDPGPYEEAGFRPIPGGPGDLEKLLIARATRESRPVATFIAEDVRNAVAIARQAHRLAPDYPVVFLAKGPRADAIRKELGVISMVGAFWIADPSDTASHLSILGDCRRTHTRRDRLKTTLDRMNLKLSSRSDQDAAHYRRLILSDRLLTSILEQAQDAILSLDTDSRILTWNRAAEGLFGYGAAEASGRSFQDLLVEAERPRFGDILSGGGILPRGPQKAEFLKKDGTAFPGDVTMGRLLGEKDATLGLSVVIRDISSRKQMELELAQAQKMEAVGKLAGGIAHDFNNLLTAINGYAAMVSEQLPPGSPLREMVDDILTSGNRAAKLTNQLLAFSRKQILVPEVLDLNAIVSEMEGLLRRLIGEHIESTAVLDPALWRTKADRSQIEQIIVNLVLNARDAMPTGGRLTLETANRVLDENYVSTHLDSRMGPHVMLSVSDTGSGISPEILPKIFDPFFTTKPVGKGTGLGLSSVYGAVKQSGGNIWVYSEPGIGTSFKIYLPAALGEVGPIPSVPVREQPSPRGKGDLILLVEDEDPVRGFAKKILERAGYRVVEARAGKEALGLAAELKESPDLLLTDIVMPGMNGKVLAQRLATLFPAMKTLYISGYTDNAIVHHGVLDPGFEFLQKPFSREQLLQWVDAALK